ncbi:MAG: hypothetical protein WC264_01830 [Candidatus Paceibacterota bacterium]|jgi:hypothetical protein
MVLKLNGKGSSRLIEFEEFTGKISFLEMLEHIIKKSVSIEKRKNKNKHATIVDACLFFSVDELTAIRKFFTPLVGETNDQQMMYFLSQITNDPIKEVYVFPTLSLHRGDNFPKDFLNSTLCCLLQGSITIKRRKNGI